jgi:hypothetical protein
MDYTSLSVLFMNYFWNYEFCGLSIAILGRVITGERKHIINKDIRASSGIRCQSQCLS